MNINNKKILMLARYVPGIKTAFEENGYQVAEDQETIIDLSPNKIKEKIKEWKEREDISYVFSMDYSSTVAECCAEWDIGYISWVVDAPHVSLLNKSIAYSTNKVFLFDYAQWEELSSMVDANLYYLPLAADIDLFSNTIHKSSEEQRERYMADVSFMGNLYDRPPHNLYDQIQYLPPYIEGYLESLMKAQMLVWGKNLVHVAIVDNVWEEIKKNICLELETDYNEQAYELFIESMIYIKIAQIERKQMCSGLAERFDFCLYSGSDTSYDEKIDNRGYVNYVTQMPLVFHCSKINVNVTLHGISTGIPLRVLDILACGGFCLTNYQEEIALYFEDGVDLVIYSDFEDMYEKIRYYLVHEDERKAIARSGYEKVKAQFSYRNSIKKIIEVLEV